MDTIGSTGLRYIDFPNSEDIAIELLQGFYYYHNNYWTFYSTSDIGVEFSANRKIQHDNNGNIYLIYQKEIAVFDGENFTVYNSSNSPLEDNYIQAAMGQNNDLYVWIEYNHLAKLQNGVWTDYGSYNINPWSYWGNAVDKYSHPWIVNADGGVLKFIDNQWIEIRTSNSGLISDEVKSICNDINGDVYFLTPDGISIFDGNDWNTVNLPYLYNIDFYNSKMTIDYSGNIWIGTKGSGVIYIEHSITTDTDNISNTNTLSIYPNPTMDFINLSFNSISNDDVLIQITDNLGRIVISFEQSANENIDVKNLPSGNYYLTAFTNEMTISAPFIKK